MMRARDEILARLRRERREEALPLPWAGAGEAGGAPAALAARFAAALTAALGEAQIAGSLAEALALLSERLRSLEAQRVVVNGDAPVAPADLAGLPAEVDVRWADRSEGDWRETCAQADVGISGADAGLADTGSVLIASGPDQSRLATLLPPVHIALLAVERLAPDIFTWAAGRLGSWPANAVFVSGPSKSADIEQTMAVGVHGPARFIVLLYSDVGREGETAGPRGPARELR